MLNKPLMKQALWSFSDPNQFEELDVQFHLVVVYTKKNFLKGNLHNETTPTNNIIDLLCTGPMWINDLSIIVSRI